MLTGPDGARSKVTFFHDGDLLIYIYIYIYYVHILLSDGLTYPNQGRGAPRTKAVLPDPCVLPVRGLPHRYVPAAILGLGSTVSRRAAILCYGCGGFGLL